MQEEMNQYLQVRYVKLYFTITFLEDTRLPVNKVSALRGGMGEMLLLVNCVRDRDCESCDFETECIVRRTMYSKFEKKPDFVTTGESIGYVLECEDRRKEFYVGDTLEFQMILFGKTIVYLNQFIQAFTMLGMQGLGKEHSRFRISEIRNTTKEVLYDGAQLDMGRYHIFRLCDYVENRIRKKKGQWKGQLTFYSPVTLKYQKEFLQEFQMEPIIIAIKRRIYMLNCYEGVDEEWKEENFEIPEIIWQDHQFVQVERYSSRQNSKMTLKGIKGRIQLNGVDDALLPLLLAGELIHIGKNTSFGFGRFLVE